MRDFKGMKRQRGRNRGSGGGSGGGGGKPQHNANRAFDSNGPEGIKVRGAAQSVYEKYQQLARDAQTAGDRVLAENYLQHAEHYFRLLRTLQPQRPLAEIIGRDQSASGYDLDFEEEPGQGDASEGEASDSTSMGDAAPRVELRQGEPRGSEDRWRDDRRRDDRPRDDRPRDDRPRDDRPRDERPREDRYRDDRERDDRTRGDRSRDERSRETRASSDRYRGERPSVERGEVGDGLERSQSPAAPSDPFALVEPRAMPFAPSQAPAAPASVLRADDGEVSHAPAFLNVRPPAPGGDSDLDPGSEARSREATPTRRRRASAVSPATDEA